MYYINFHFASTDSSRQSISGKPRLVRQSAVQDETQEPTSPRLNVRFLPTIPSAPDSSVQLDDENQENENDENANENLHTHQDCVQMQNFSENSSSPKIKSKPP